MSQSMQVSVPRNAWFDIATTELFRELGALRVSDYDQLPFGVIALDREHRVAMYNEAEASFAQRERAAVVGKKFFEEVAPCTRVRAFGEMIEASDPDAPLDSTLRFTFRFVHGWREATIRIVREPARSPYTFIFVRPKRKAELTASQDRDRGAA